MAVSAADFYTYAKSTGTEIPDSKQKEAELVPVINRWKKGRLREENKPEQDNTGRNIGAAALGTGAAALAYGIGRRLGRGKGSNPVSKPPQAAPSNLPNVDNVTGLADTTFIPSPITPQDSRGVTLVGTRNPKTGTYRAAVNEIQEQAPSTSPSTSPQTKVQNTAADEALWDSNYWANFHTLRKADPSLDLGEVDRRAVLAAKKATNQPIREDYTPGPATDHRIELQNTPESSPVKFSPRSYAESTGSVAPKTQKIVSSPTQFSKEQLNELNTYADSVIDYDGDKDFIRIQDKLENYLGGRTDVYPLTQQDLQKFDNSFTNLKRTDLTAMDHELDVLHSEVGVKLGRKPTEYTNRDIDLEDKRLYEINVEGSSNIQQPGIFSDDPELNPKGYKYSSEEGVYQLTPNERIIVNAGEDSRYTSKYDSQPKAKEQTFLAEQIQSQPTQPDTLVAKQNLNDPALSIQSSEAVDTGVDQAIQRIDTEVQRDTDSISLGKSAVKTEVLQEDLLEQAAANKAQAAGLIAARRIQLEQAGLRPGTTEFDNALVKGWSAKSDVEPSVISEKFRENVVLPKEVEEVVSTKIPESDASNVARNYYNEDTGNIQFATEDGGSPLIRAIYKEKVLPSEDVSKAASGTSIRGRSRSLDIAEPKVRTRTNEFTGNERPDRIGGTLPIGGVPAEIDGQPTIISGPSKIEEANLRDAGLYPKVLDKTQYPNPQMAPQLSKQEVVHSIINPSPVSRKDLTGGGAGMGVYGRQLGYVPGPTSATAGTKPTQLPEGRYGEFNPTTSRDEFRNYSTEALQKRIDTGTYQSGKVSEGAREAQKELTLRTNLDYPVDYTPSKETTINSMQVSDDIRKIYSSGRPDAQQQVEAYKSALRKKMGI